MVADVVPLLALVALLVVAYRHPPEWLEALAAVLAAGAVLLTGAVGHADLTAERHHLVPVVLFLVAILVVAECCRAAGLFTAIGTRLAGAGSAGRVFALAFAVAAVTTVALSLDATVVLVTPVVLAAARAQRLEDRPYLLVCVRLANVASLLLPVSNLTNLLALPALDLSVARFALLMAPVWVLVLVLEYAAHRVRFAGVLHAPTSTEGLEVQPVPRVPLLVVALMLAAFAVLRSVDPAWIAGAAALVLVVRGLRRGELGIPALARSAHLSFALFVLGLGLVVAALGNGAAGDRLADLVPQGNGLPDLLAVAFLGAALSNVVNNLPATLLLVPLVAPLGTVPVLATLIGINLGSSMTWTGSLANLLWRRTVLRSGAQVSSRDFHVLGWTVTPVSIAAGVVVLHVWSGLV
ncbi:MAG: SLC13 family permease [Marmoricola sp.]